MGKKLLVRNFVVFKEMVILYRHIYWFHFLISGHAWVMRHLSYSHPHPIVNKSINLFVQSLIFPQINLIIGLIHCFVKYCVLFFLFLTRYLSPSIVVRVTLYTLSWLVNSLNSQQLPYFEFKLSSSFWDCNSFINTFNLW